MATPRKTATELNADLLARTDGISILPQDVGASTDGSAVNATGFTRVEAQAHVAAASAGTDFTLKVQKSPDGSSGWVDVPASEISPGQPATINDDLAANHNKAVSASVTIDTTKPHLRWTSAGAGGTPALLASAGFKLGSSARDLKPFELRQIQDALKRVFHDFGSGEPPAGQASVQATLANG